MRGTASSARSTPGHRFDDAARRRGVRRALRGAGIVAAFALTTVGVAVAEGPAIGIADASPLYLIAVAAAAALGQRAGLAAAVAAFALYDLLFVDPRFTLTVDDPREWLDLLLFLIVAVVIGRLTGLQRDRAVEAQARLREAAGAFAISRTLATAETTAAALPRVLDVLLADSGMRSVRLTRDERGNATVAEAGEPAGRGSGRIVNVLVRRPGSRPAEWVRTHQRDGIARGSGPRLDDDLYRVGIEADGQVVGFLWGIRPRADGRPSREETRLLSLAADQVGLAWQRERLAGEARSADVARRSEAAQSALLESVSHDLRTPLASIRASAGGLADEAVAWSDADRRAAARRIDAEAERLNGLVENLLDLSRIEGGGLVPRLEPHELSDLIEPALGRLVGVLPAERVTVSLPWDLAPVLVDPVLMDQAIGNVLENAAHHAAGAAVTITAAADPATAMVTMRIEDEGPGVSDAALARLFERFYRAPRARAPTRRGLGLGLAVVRATVEAMGGTVSAERGASGGLAVVLRLPAAALPGASG